MTTINPPCREPYITFYSLLTNDVSMKIATGVTKTTWRTVGLFLLTFVLVVLLQPAGALGLMMLVDSSGGLINPTLLNGTFGILILVGGVVLWYGSLAPRDIGIVPKKLPRAVGLTAGFWFLFTAAQAVYGLTVGDLSLHPDVTGQEAITTVGLALGYIVGNAPFEELAFRGFLLVQLYLLLDGKWWQLNPSTRIVTAIIGSSLVYASPYPRCRPWRCRRGALVPWPHFSQCGPTLSRLHPNAEHLSRHWNSRARELPAADPRRS